MKVRARSPRGPAGVRRRHRSRRVAGIALLAALVAGLAAGPAQALEPSEVLVVANRNARGSMDLAAYYLERRAIPPENLLRLWVTDAETCTRKEYDERIAAPVRERLEADPGLRAAVLMYGVPLRVAPPEPSPEERRTLARLEREREELAQGAAVGEGGADRLRERLEAVEGLLRDIRRADWEASADSELALVRAGPYPLRGWVPNPAFSGEASRNGSLRAESLLAVSRLDGPSEALVRRVVDDGLAAEAEGLEGTAYLDARWKDPGPDAEVSGYALYDRSLHRAAAVLRAQGLAAVVDDRPELFPEGAALPAALYCGWYSLSRYVGAFAWRRGAVGYHIASGECTTLKRAGNREWCQRLLEEGAAATLGPVGEPYVQAFPPPALFFELLVRERLPLAEAYLRSVPYLSWKMVLLGDPLYRPFRPR